MLRQMLIVSLTLMIPAILLPVLFTTDYFSRSMTLRAEEQALTDFQLVQTRINETLSTAVNDTFRLDQDQAVYDYLFSRGRLAAADARPGSRAEINARRGVVESVSTALEADPVLGSVIYLREDGPYCGASSHWRFFGLTRDFPADPFLSYTDIPYTIHWLSAYPQQFFSVSAPGTAADSDYLIYGVRTVLYTTSTGTGTRQRVTVLLGVTQDALLRCYDQIADASGRVFLLDASGRPLVASSGTFGNPPDWFDSVDTEEAFSSARAEADGQDCQVISFRLEPMGWWLVKTIPYTVYTANIRTLAVTALVSGSIALLLLVLLLTVWVRRFCRPIARVTDSLTRVQDGDLALRLPEESGTAEIRLLETQFNRMLDSLNELLVQREADERAKLSLEMRSLQTQITPHFIYNTITSIRFAAQMRGDTVVADMLISLIRLLRPIFSEWTPEWTLGEELAFSENYMTLMRMRFGDRIRFEVQSAPDLSDCLVPRFTLQPVLENCCEHSAVTEHPLTVRIRIRTEIAEGPHPRDAGPALVLDVEDDGDGIPAEKLQILKSRMDETSSDPLPSGAHAGIGLANINRRIKLNYGPAYGVAIDSQAGKGTRVSLWLGLKR